MKFYLSGENNLVATDVRNSVVLTHTYWDDWFKYETSYNLNYVDEEGRYSYIGSTKIGQSDMAENQKVPSIPEEFEALGDNFFSLGQDESFYKNLNARGANIRDNILHSLNDLAFDQKKYEEVANQDVVRTSLLRDVSVTSVKGQFNRLARGNPALTQFSFKYTLPEQQGADTRLTLEFEIIPNVNPPSNIHAIIGRNGVGKTHLLTSMIESLLSINQDEPKGYFSSDDGNKPFANLISISFSAFDETYPIEEVKNNYEIINYSYIGLKCIDENTTKSQTPDDLMNDFIKSIEKCKGQGKTSRWKKALEGLESDPVFKDAEVSSIANENNKERIEKKFRRLSTGHKIVILTITRLIEKLEEKSLVLLDEPESHLHPPLLSAYIRVLSKIMLERNGVAIICTHSPVILQEVPKSCTWILRRFGVQVSVERPNIETFGENVGTLTNEVFGLEVTNSGFHQLLKDTARNHNDYNEALASFQGQLGQEARAILRGMILRNERDN